MRQALELALEALEDNRQTHHYCEDTWYSCPKHEEGCANESEGDECNCGADKANAEIDQAVTAIKEALAQPEQEPVAFIDNRIHGFPDCFVNQSEPPHTSPVYIAPPQRKPLTDEDIAEFAERMEASDPTDSFWREFARAIEAAHGIKE